MSDRPRVIALVFGGRKFGVTGEAGADVAEAQRQARLAAAADVNGDDQQFIEAVAVPWDADEG